MGGVTRRSLLASLMALSLLCGGLGVAEATVHVNEGTGVTHEVYTTVETYSREVADAKLDLKADKTDVATNKANIATNADKITKLENDKLDKALASETYATKDALNDLKDTVNGKADKDAVTTALSDKADKADVYSKTGADDKFATKDALNNKADKSYVDTAVAGAVTTAGTNVDAKLVAYATTADVNNALKGKADKATTLAGYGITDAYTKSDVHKRLNEKANKTDLTQAQTEIDGLNAKTTKITYDASNGTSVDGVTFNAGTVTGVTSINGTKIGTPEGGKYISQDGSIWGNMKKVDTQVETNTTAIAQEKTDRENAIGSLTEDKNYIKKDKNVSDNLVELDKQAKTNADAITKTNQRTAGITRDDTKKETSIEGRVTVDTNGNIKAEGTITSNGLDARAGEIKTTGKVSAGDISTGTLETTGNAKIGGDLTVDGKLNVGEIYLEHKKLESTGKDYDSATSITADGISNRAKVTELGHTTESQFTHNEKGTFNYAKDGDSTDWTETRSDVTADGVNTEVKDSKGNRTNTSQTKEGINGFAIDEDGNSSTTSQTAKDINGNVTDKDGNKTDMKVTATENSIQIQDKDGKNTNHQVNTMGSSVTEIKNGDGKTTKTEQTATDITNTAEQGTIKNTAMNIENNASGNITNNAQYGTITNNAKDIVNNATGDMTNTVGGKLTTTVKGQATEDFKGGLNTTVTGAENHTVTGKQTNTVEGGQENIISGGQTNTITGGQINNITGDQTTTITGNKTETVTENVTEDYKKNLTTTVSGNEIHEVKGTKTETVEGKLTENFKGGQETNVTGDQTTNVSGTQTTTATDIKRNASSGMIDTIDNDYGTNTETKVAGKTTTDVSIKGTGEKGQYIRGANESRDYLIKGTLKNSETKTVDATSTEITDGKGKTSATIQDVNNLAGSVINGTETGVSGIHANDDSVSIDSIVTDGNKSYSVINQKKGSIQSTVVDGTNSTVILQDKDNVTIASSNGTVAIGGKDIVNNAQNTITNTAGTSITNQVKDSKVTTDANGTTFENNTAAVSDGGKTTTQINGNQITTGRVNANELAVSDKDGANTADFSVKAEDGVKASASNGTTTGSLDVKADEVVSSVKDASGKGSTFKQRIDAIMMESKNVSIKAEETLTNEAKDIVTNASNSITEKVGETNVTTKTTTSSKSEIQNADTITSVQQTENMVQSFVGKKDFSTTNVTTNLVNASANAVTENGQTSTVLNNKDGLLVRNTANGKSFTTADGTNTGTALEWTNVKGNEISTGKVEANYVKMDYADVMKDLGVRGNAKIAGKTTTGSLEVTGTSTLKGDVTMESNATVKKDLTVEGTTTTKTLKVTENAEIDGTLKVAKKATFEDSVSIAKDLSVDGNATIKGDVTAKSYKVGDKTYIDKNGIHANGQKITDVADGSISEGSKDAVNGGQLYGVKNDLEGKVNKVGANAAAMANLHPMEFDPDSKWNIAAAIGNYGSETAAALGAFYRPNDDVMVNLSTAFGTGENMVGGGVSVRLGKSGNKLSREESNALKDQVNDLTARMDALLSVLNPNMSKDFPDVPENHWAYEAVSRLAGNDIVQGYPDGEFHGERTMTRYEMAEIIYNALSRGAEAEKELVEEFKPELQAMAASEKATAERAEG